MVVLEYYEETDTILTIRVLGGITNLNLELQVGNLKRCVEFQTFIPVIIPKVTCDKLASITVGALDEEVSSDRGCRLVMRCFKGHCGCHA